MVIFIYLFFFFCHCLIFSLHSPSVSLFLSLDGIVSFLKKQAGPASVELKAEADFEKYVTDQDASVVGELMFEL